MIVWSYDYFSPWKPAIYGWQICYRKYVGNRKICASSWPIPVSKLLWMIKPKHQSKALMAPRLQELYPAHWDQPKCVTGRAPENSATFGDYCPVPGRDGFLPPHQGCTTKSLSRPALLPQEVAIRENPFQGWLPAVSNDVVERYRPRGTWA